jgi:very-long-chain ceramide synthase
MIPELKSYYLIQAAYWCQQLIVMIFGLEKPRKDYKELVAHHFVTLWLIGYVHFLEVTGATSLTKLSDGATSST